jgi:hypothetical protein
VGGAVLLLQYFILLPPFAWAAKRREKREPLGWAQVASRHESPTSQY